MTESARASNLRPATESRYSVPRIRGEPDARSLAGEDRGAEKGLDPTVPARPAREEGEVRVPDSPRTPRAVDGRERREGERIPGGGRMRRGRRTSLPRTVRVWPFVQDLVRRDRFLPRFPFRARPCGRDGEPVPVRLVDHLSGDRSRADLVG